MVVPNKVLIIGDAGVGKTVLVNRLKTGEFNPKYIANNKMETYDIEGFKINVFPGQYKYSFNKLIYGNEEYNMLYDRIIIMCDIHSKLSQQNVYNWLKLTRGICHSKTSIVLCINKRDYTSGNELTGEELLRFIGVFDHIYYVSAKINLNIYKILGDCDPKLAHAVAPPQIMIRDTDCEKIYSKIIMNTEENQILQ
jgi:GTP-binding nuclear protein Ran